MKISIGKYPEHRWYHNFLFLKFGYSPKQKQKIRIDPYDVWSMDTTLASIVVPMLYQLKMTKQGAPFVTLEDAPPGLRPSKEELAEYVVMGVPDHLHFERWDWVLDEMIFAFESKTINDEWESEYHYGEVHFLEKDLPDGSTEFVKGPNDTFRVDREAIDVIQT